MTRDPYGGNFKLARAQAFNRSGGTCQLCGAAPATDAHHWAFDDYLSGEDVEADDLVALCQLCHEVATTLRRTLRAGRQPVRDRPQHHKEYSIMQYRFRISGISPLLMHNGAAGLDTRSPLSREIAAITAKRGGNRTESEDERLRELECRRSLWLDEGGAPAIPETAVGAATEAGAKKRRQGPQVRGGLMVLETVFEYDREKYGTTQQEIGRSAQFTVPVVVKGNRIARTRARFDTPWSCTVTVDVDGELIDREQLLEWLEIAGRQVGLGDWRPEKSGAFGRFNVASFEAVADGGHDGAGAAQPVAALQG